MDRSTDDVFLPLIPGFLYLLLDPACLFDPKATNTHKDVMKHFECAELIFDRWESYLALNNIIECKKNTLMEKYVLKTV